MNKFYPLGAHQVNENHPLLLQAPFIHQFIEACSSAAVEIVYWSNEYYEVEVSFMNANEWKAEQVSKHAPVELSVNFSFSFSFFNKMALLADASETKVLSSTSHRVLRDVFGPGILHSIFLY